MSARRRLRRLSWGLAILFLVALVVLYRYRTSQSPEWFDWNAFAETFRGMDKSSLAFALLAISATYILRSLRWQQYTLPLGRTRLKNLLVAHIIRLHRCVPAGEARRGSSPSADCPQGKPAHIVHAGGSAV